MKNTKNETIDKRKPVDLGVLVFLVYFAITFAIISYVWWFLFRHNSDLSTDSAVWGSFGDYFNGFVSPVVGFVTVVLIFRAYRTQEKEFSETTKSLKIQIEQGKISAKRDVLWKSADKVFNEVYFEKFSKQSDQLTTNVFNRVPDVRMTDRAQEFLVKDFVPLLWELRHYLGSIDELSDNDTRSTDFYRRRIFDKFNIFAYFCTELDEVLQELKPDINWSGLIDKRKVNDELSTDESVNSTSH